MSFIRNGAEIECSGRVRFRDEPFLPVRTYLEKSEKPNSETARYGLP